MGVPEEAKEAPLEEESFGRPLGEPGVDDGSSEEEAMLSAKKLKTVAGEASYVIVASPGKIFRLHRAGSYGCRTQKTKRHLKKSAEAFMTCFSK